jgi:hypothetical protein
MSLKLTITNTQNSLFEQAAASNGTDVYAHLTSWQAPTSDTAESVWTLSIATGRSLFRKLGLSIQLHPHPENCTNENDEDNGDSAFAPFGLLIIQSNEFALRRREKPL